MPIYPGCNISYQNRQACSPDIIVKDEQSLALKSRKLEIDNLYRVECVITNNGLLSIYENDFKEPLRFKSIGDIIQFQVTSISNKNISFDQTSIGKNSLKIRPSILEQNDSVVFEFLLTGSSEIHVQSKIKGIEKIQIKR